MSSVFSNHLTVYTQLPLSEFITTLRLSVYTCKPGHSATVLMV